MSSERKPKSRAEKRVEEKLLLYFEQLKSDERALAEAAFQKALQDSRQVHVLDLWEEPELADSSWLLLLTGINQQGEMEIASGLLSWKAFLAKRSARLACVPSSELAEFRHCSSKFGVVNCPTLVFSDTIDMSSFVKIGPELLFALAKQEGSLQRFLTKIQTLLENGANIAEVKRAIFSEQFWSSLRFVYKEMKGLLSLSVEAVV